jgi:hypothetical protein
MVAKDYSDAMAVFFYMVIGVMISKAIVSGVYERIVDYALSITLIILCFHLMFKIYYGEV